MEDKKESNDINFVDLIVMLLEAKKLILTTVGISLFCGIIYYILATPLYRSTITLYPAYETVETNPMSTMARQLGVGGLKSGEANFNIPDIVSSRTLSEKVVGRKWKIRGYENEINLIEYFDMTWNIETEAGLSDDGLKTINQIKLSNYGRYLSSQRINVKYNEDTGLITVSVDMEDPFLSRDVAEFISKFVTNWVNDTQIESIKKNLEFVNERVTVLYNELQQAENEFKKFRETNRNILNSPDLQLELQRLQRQVTIKQEVYLTMVKQRELNQIEENKNADVVRVLDEANIAHRPYRPKLLKVTAVSIFSGIGLGILFMLILSFLETNKTKLNLSKRFIIIRSIFIKS